MGGKRLSGIIAVAGVALAITACSGGGTTGSFVPQGGGGTSPATPATQATTTAVKGLQVFNFPQTVQIDFQSELPASGPKREAAIAYENYIDSMWYAAYTHGASKAYERYTSGNVLSFVRTVIHEVSKGDTISGTIMYFDTSVPSVYYGNGALVESCVNASGLYLVNAKTGKNAGNVISTKYDSYQEQAAAAKEPGGAWAIINTQNYRAASGGSAGMCAS
jgi:hypothetical protein